MKKVKIITLIAIIYIGLILINTQVYAASTGKTINDTTRLREKASTSSSTVTLISINQEVEIISQDGDWYKVKYKNNGKTYSGYIRSDMLDINEKEKIEQEENKTAENTENSTESGETVDNTQEIEIKEKNTGILKSKIEIRILPLINSSITGNISKKTEITILETLGNWTYIESEEQVGWVIASELQQKLTSKKDSSKQENKKEENKPTETVKKEEVKKEETTSTDSKKEEQQEESKMYISSQTVNLRKEANSSSTILKQLSRNKQVTVIEKVNNTWSKVKVDGITGYISSTYLSEKKTEVTSRGSEKSREEKEEEKITTLDSNKEDKKEENKKEEIKKEENKTTETAKKEETKAEDTSKKETNTSSKVTGSDIVKYAKKYLGYKYVLGAASPKKGFDCSGLTSYVYSKNGYTLNRTSAAQASNGKKVSKSNLKAGDLVFFSQGSKKIGHVGIYIGGNEFIHAANPKKGVVITSLSNSYYAKNYVTARRIID